MLTDCVLVYSNADDNKKKYKAQRHCQPKGIIKNYNFIINGTKLLQYTNWFWRKKIGTNKRFNKRARWRLYYRMLARLWMHQKSLHINGGWLKSAKGIRYWSKSNLANRISWKIKKKIDNNGNATDAGADQSMFVLTI